MSKKTKISNFVMFARPRTLILFTITGIGILCFGSEFVAGKDIKKKTALSNKTSTVYTWQQTTSGDWQLPSNWTPERTNPASTDVLVFNLGGTASVTNVPTQSIGQLIVSGNTMVNLQTVSLAALTISGGDDVDLVIAAGSALNFDGLNAITINVASGATGNILGSVTFSSPTSSAHRLTAVDANGISFGNGAIFTAGQGFIGNAFGTTNLNSIIFESGSTYIRLAGEDPFGATEPASVLVFKVGSLFSLRSPTLFAQSSFYSGRTYANFEYDNPSDSDIQGTSALVMDDLTVRAGQLYYNVNGSPGHSIKGNITVLQGSGLSFQSAFPGHTINLNGNAPQTLNVRGSISVNPGNTFAIDNPSGVTITRRFIAWNLKLVNGVVTVQSPSYYFSVPGTVTRVNGYIDGSLSREITSSDPMKFDVGTANGYSPVIAEVTAGHDFPAGMIVRAVQAAHPNILDPSKALSRHWQVFGSSNIDEANLTFHYLDPTDIPPTTNESEFVIERYTNGFTQPAGVIDTQANFFTATRQGNLNSFTYYTLADPAAAVTPTATSTPTASPTATATPICPPIVLYDQSGSGTGGVSSQDFDIANDPFDAQAADDFVVPEGQTWTVQKVVVNGIYFNGVGPADSFNVVFYTDASLFPGSAVAGGTFTGAGYDNVAGVFTITLPSDLVLTAGVYWVAVQARMDGVPGGQWGWANRISTRNSLAVWRNPGGGFNIPACVEWARRGATCNINPAAPDQVFQIMGTLGTIGACVSPTATATPTACPRPGCLDQTFDGDGMVTTDFGDATGDGVAIQPDGKIVVAGLANRGSNADMAIVRYNPDGSPDTSFGVDGKVTTDFFGSVDYATSVIIQPDGKIVVAGSASLSSFALARYNTDGSLDLSFDGDGKVTTSIANGTEANDLILQSDGKIIAVGSVNWQAQAALIRYNTDGSLDTSFDSDGKVLPAFAGSASSVKLQTDNKIVIGGTISGDFLLARFETDGRTDTSFGSGGLTATDMSGGNSDAGNDLAIQSDGRIVLVGSAGSPARDFAMLRSNADGTLDTTFGSGGRVITEFGPPSSANGVVIQSNGKIVTAGGSGDFADGNFALSRHNADGSLDLSFGSAGLVNTDFAIQTEYVLGVVLQPDGKIVSAGFTEVNTDIYAFGVARYLAGGDSRTASDYDGDRKADISVFRPTDGAWYLQQSQAGPFGMLFGAGDDKIAPADYDGDGKTDIAVYRPSTGIWYVLKSSTGTVEYYVFGLAEDLPTPADYDGDGKADVSVYRPSTGTWYRQNSSNGSFAGIQFGATEDKPTVGDFDGDGKSDIAVFRPSTGAWYRINSSNGSIYGELFGFGTDIITPADYDGDGKTDLAAYRPTDGIWYLKYSSNSTYDYKVFGLANDIPAPADFDGDGKADICVFRPSDGTWYRQNSSDGAFTAFQFGASGDKPTMTAFRY